MTITPADILPNHIVKVLVEGDEVYYASVLSNEGEYLFVSYLVPIFKNYKTAPVHGFEAKAERVDFVSLMEHHFNSNEINVKKVGINMFVFIDEIDPDSDSEIETEESSDSEYDSLDGFVVPDTVVDGDGDCDPELNRQWDDWSPHTPSAIRYKSTVDQIEAIARVQGDNQSLRTLR